MLNIENLLARTQEPAPSLTAKDRLSRRRKLIADRDRTVAALRVKSEGLREREEVQRQVAETARRQWEAETRKLTALKSERLRLAGQITVAESSARRELTSPPLDGDLERIGAIRTNILNLRDRLRQPSVVQRLTTPPATSRDPVTLKKNPSTELSNTRGITSCLLAIPTALEALEALKTADYVDVEVELERIIASIPLGLVDVIEEVA